MRVDIAVLGGFAVSVDGVLVPRERWQRRHAATLVKLLALAPRARLHRDRVVDALWPDVGTDLALPRLHKAAHYARQALDARDAVVLKDETVALFPAATLDVDALTFEAAADAALRTGTGTADACGVAIALYGGELLPDDINEAWSEEPQSSALRRPVRAGAGRAAQSRARPHATRAPAAGGQRPAAPTADRPRCCRRCWSATTTWRRWCGWCARCGAPGAVPSRSSPGRPAAESRR